MTPEERQQEKKLHAEQLKTIRDDINRIKVEGRWIGGIQLAVIGLVFFFGIQTLTDLKSKIKL